MIDTRYWMLVEDPVSKRGCSLSSLRLTPCTLRLQFLTLELTI